MRTCELSDLTGLFGLLSCWTERLFGFVSCRTYGFFGVPKFSECHSDDYSDLRAIEFYRFVGFYGFLYN